MKFALTSRQLGVLFPKVKLLIGRWLTLVS